MCIFPLRVHTSIGVLFSLIIRPKKRNVCSQILSYVYLVVSAKVSNPEGGWRRRHESQGIMAAISRTAVCQLAVALLIMFRLHNSPDTQNSISVGH